MMVCGNEVARWVLAPHSGIPAPKVNGLGWMKDGKLIGGLMVDEWNGKNVFVHIRLEGFIPRAFWFAMVDWVFNQMECERMTAPICKSNKKIYKLLQHMKWEHEGTLKDAGYDGSDLLFMTWHKKDCFMLNWNRK